jgi:hypothetical protein
MLQDDPIEFNQYNPCWTGQVRIEFQSPIMRDAGKGFRLAQSLASGRSVALLAQFVQIIEHMTGRVV